MLIFGKGTVFTFDEKSTVINDGGVAIDGEMIKEVGKSRELKAKYPEAEFRNVEGRVIMPGMINTHMHFYSTFARGMDLKIKQPPANFLEILEKLWWRLDSRLNENDIYYSSLYAIVDGIKKGTTTIFDHHASFGLIDGSLDIIAEAVKKAGIRANLAYEVSDRHGTKRAVASLKENERFIKGLSRLSKVEKNYLGGMIGLHASFTLEDETLVKAASLAAELEVPFHLHVAEGKVDVDDSRKRGYQGIVDRLDQFKLWVPGTLAIHGVHLKEKELSLLAERDCYLIHNPQSNMGNAVGAAPLQAAINEGLTVGLGTDGYTTDMFTSLQTANLLQSHKQQDPGAGGAEPGMILNNNRELANRFFPGEMGRLQPGQLADLIVIDYKPPTPITSDNYLSHILMGIEGSMVDTTVVGGKVLMENQEVKVLDYEKLSRETKQQAADFWKRF